MASTIAIFDFDGTIVDSLELTVTAYNRLAPRYRTKPVQRSDLQRLRGVGMEAAMREHRVSFWKVPLLVAAMRRALRDGSDALLPFPGMLDALRGLESSGVRCSVLSTNSSDNIRRILARHDARMFEHIAGGVSVFGKARALDRLIKRAGFAREQVVYVGDEVRDLQAARAAGVRAVAVSWGYSSREALAQESPDHIADRPDELLAILQ